VKLLNQTDLQKKDKTALAARIALLLVFALGISIILMGTSGLRSYEASGFSSETAYQAIYSLSEAVEGDWKGDISPLVQSLPPEQQETLEPILYALLTDAWEKQKSGAGEELEALFAETGENNRSALLHKLLYITYQVGGPKVSASQKKALSAVPEASQQTLRQEILFAVADPVSPVPDAAAAAEGLEGSERSAMLMQLLYTSLGDKSRIRTEDINTFKKGIRDKALQLDAFRMTANREVSWLNQFVISNSRTVVLAGILLALDAALLAFLMASGRSWHFDVKWIIILVIVDFLLLFQLMPLVYMVIKAFFPDSKLSFETFKRLYTYSLNLDALRNTTIAAFSTMIVGTLLAFPLAWLVGRTNLYGRKFFRSLFVLTYMVPPYVGAMAWLRLLNPNVGTVNQWLRALLHLSDAPGPLNVYSLPGLIWVLSTFYYPYAFITISRAMEKMDPSLEEATRASGASPLKTVMTVTLPLMMPSLIAGALLVFVSAASCYGIPSIIGSPGRVHTVTTRIVEYVSLGQQGLNDATGMAVFLMVVAIIILFVSDVVLAKKQYITVSGKSVNPTIVDLRKWRIPLTVLVSLFAVVVILIPFATIFSTSFKIDVGKSMLRQDNFTLSNWKTVFGRIETVNCLKNSLVFAVVAATVGIVIACTMSYLLQRTTIRGRKIPDFLITLGSGTPSVVIALGLIMTMKGNFGINIYNTAYIMIIAYLIKYLMMGMRTVVSAMSQIHVSLEECSQISGASWLKTMFRITGRLIFPSIAAGWFLIFIPSFYELSMTTLLYSSTTKTIGFQLYEYWTFTSQPMACAMAFGILMIVVILNFVLNRLTKGEFSI
jgi:iron(III) transport system permease protein